MITTIIKQDKIPKNKLVCRWVKNDRTYPKLIAKWEIVSEDF